MFVDVNKPATGATSQWIAESGIVDLFLLVGPRPSDVSAQYATVTGGSAMPQMFALG
jgi:mannosyl-oligosaccharide alpha-1,3-glucosidase